MSVDYVAGTSAVTILTMRGERDLIFHGEGSKSLAPSKWRKIIRNSNIFHIFYNIPARQWFNIIWMIINPFWYMLWVYFLLIVMMSSHMWFSKTGAQSLSKPMVIQFNYEYERSECTVYIGSVFDINIHHLIFAPGHRKPINPIYPLNTTVCTISIDQMGNWSTQKQLRP